MTRTLALAALAAAAAIAGCGEAPAPPNELDAVLSTITPGTLGTHRDYLADDALDGRLTGTAGYDAAARYVAERFESYGLAPAGEDDWYQQVPLQSYRVDTDSTTLVAHRDGGDRELVYRKQYTMGGDVVRETTSVRAEVVYAGFGVHAPDFGYSDYEGIDVEGRIIAIFDNAPPALPHNERAYYASSSTKYRQAVERGAVGIIALRSRHAQASSPWERIEAQAGTKPAMTWLADDGRADDYYPQLQGGALLSETAAEEFFRGTPLSFEEALDATEASRVASVSLGFELTLARNTQHEEIESPNVIGIVRGSDVTLAEEFILYTAHLDGLGQGVAVDGDDIYNGAYDNATGIALMLETARVFALHPPRRSVMFLAVTAEEKGLLGSDYFAHYPTVPIDAIVANVNLDMPLFLVPVADVVAFGAEHSSLEQAVAEAASAEGFAVAPDPMPEEVIFIRSDQYSLVRQGVPAIFLVPGFRAASGDIDGGAAFRDFLGQHYHRPSDELSLPVDWDSAVRFARTNARIGYITGNADTRPSWKEGDFFGEMFGGRP